MHRKFKTILLPLTLIASMTPFIAPAAGPPEGVSRQMVRAVTLPDIPGHKLTAVTVKLDPSVTIPSHKHEGFVFVYVLEGTVRSRLDDNEATEFNAGDSWVEPPGAIHTLTQNPSKTETARILAIFVAKSDAKLTTSGEIAN
ncbi:MAG: cupin domain-containing protein [Acidiferrobacterales bacterium]|jgi:quercetin dioxygenase-like cupin family protein